MKVCTKCGEEKNKDLFCKHRGHSDGLSSNCKTCDNARSNAYYASDKAAAAIRNKKYNIEHKDEISKNRKQYYQANKEDIKAQARGYSVENKAKILAAHQRYYQKNIDAITEYKRQWYIENYRSNTEYKEQRKIYVQNYALSNRSRLRTKDALHRANKLRATPKWANKELVLNIYKLAEEQERMTGIKQHVDHIVPLNSKYVCGLHCEANLQILSAQENQVKSNRYWPDMP
jgi:hypothetical protein